MDTPNTLKDPRTRLQEAKAWLQEHPTESITTTSKIFKIPRTTLSSSIIMESRRTRSRGGRNRILTPIQEESLNKFITSYLDHGHLPTKGVVLSAITHLRKQQDKPPPSNNWFLKWWKTQPLHKIKTKPIARTRITAQDKQEVKRWFEKYRDALEKYSISRKDIWNFEIGFRVGCPRGEQIYVPVDVKEVSLLYLIRLLLTKYSGILLALKIDALLPLSSLFRLAARQFHLY
jgi:hypothetical protein